MSDEPSTSSEDMSDQDRRADLKAILIVFGTCVLFAVHFISGFTFDF